MKKRLLLYVCLFGLLPALLQADETKEFRLNGSESVFGAIECYSIVDDKETLVELALRYGLGYYDIVTANPDVDPWFPGKGEKVLLPTAWILPWVEELSRTDRPVVIINLAELRLYLVINTGTNRKIMTFPVGIGYEGNETPPGHYRIIQKLKNPYWYVPESIRQEYPELPPVVPPGPDNPLGEYALRLSISSYLIHGTNKPLGVGRRISHGCIRMYPEDIKKVFEVVNKGDPVVIIDRPVKIGRKDGQWYIEVEPIEDRQRLLQTAVKELLRYSIEIPTKDLYRLILNTKGVPVPIAGINSVVSCR